MALDTQIVAEMACAHEGSLDLLYKISQAAHDADADILQLQIWSLPYMMSPNRKEYSLLEKIEFSYEQWTEIVQTIRKNFKRLKIFVCVYEHNSLDFINSLGIDGYKLNSSDLTNFLVLDKVASFNLPVHLSVGASSVSEIQFAVNRLRKNNAGAITLMYGHQNFPTEPATVNLEYMRSLGQLFDLPYGYQDHCDADDESAFWLPAASMGMGPSVIEKHITHDRSLKGIDHESALNPDEFAKFVKMVRTIDNAKGEKVPRPFSESETKYREFQKKTIVAKCQIRAGEEITSDNICFMRAETLNFTPDRVSEVLGKKASSAISRYEVLTNEHFS